MESRTEVMLAAWAGVVGFVLSVVGGLLAGEFNDRLYDTPSDVVDFFQGAVFDAKYVIGVVLEVAAFLLIMAFLIKLAQLVQGGRDRTGWLGNVIVASVIVALVLGFVSIVGLAAGTFRASNGGLVGDGYVVLSDVRQLAYWVSLPAWALIFLTSGTLIIRRRSFPLWLGWAALLIGVMHIVVSFIDSVAAWDAATGLGGLWFVATAVHMLIRPDAHSLPRFEESAPG